MITHRSSEQFSEQFSKKRPVEAGDEKRWVQVSFLAVAVLFNLCLVAQLLTVGLAIFSDTSWWQVHVWLVRGYGGMAVLLLMGTFLTPLPKRVQVLTKAIAILLLLQFVTAHVQQPLPLSILHPLTGFALFTTSTTLVHRALSLVTGHPNSDSNSSSRKSEQNKLCNR